MGCSVGSDEGIVGPGVGNCEIVGSRVGSGVGRGVMVGRGVGCDVGVWACADAMNTMRKRPARLLVRVLRCAGKAAAILPGVCCSQSV